MLRSVAIPSEGPGSANETALAILGLRAPFLLLGLARIGTDSLGEAW